jgi:hypothetical protein
MANIILYKSSCVSAFIHILFFINIKCEYDILFYIIISGLITSILNHKYTDDMLKYLDRLMMCIGATNHIYYIYFHIYYFILYIFLLLCILLYLCAKITISKQHSNILHMLSHFLLTIVHIILLI